MESLDQTLLAAKTRVKKLVEMALLE